MVDDRWRGLPTVPDAGGLCLTKFKHAKPGGAEFSWSTGPQHQAQWVGQQSISIARTGAIRLNRGMNINRAAQKLDTWQQGHAPIAFLLAVSKKYSEDNGGYLAALLA